jgi:hypothetical protein
MKIIKKKHMCAPCTASLWWIPTISYSIMSINGVEFHREWIWWVTIPTLILVWGLLNWTIKK